MFVVITGGSGSGKSAYGEEMAASFRKEGALIYVATMEPFSGEAKERIKRHRDMRKDKGFETIECYRQVGRLDFEPNATVLLECMSNLLANELFGTTDKEEKCRMGEKIAQDIFLLEKKCGNLIVITNEVFSDGILYDKDTMEYVEKLGYINRAISNRADEVYEVVYGIPVLLKGRKS